jgi:hypothetical protein
VHARSERCVTSPAATDFSTFEAHHSPTRDNAYH